MVGPDQAFGDHGGVRRARAMPDQRVADEAPELVVTDFDAIAAHSFTPLRFPDAVQREAVHR